MSGGVQTWTVPATGQYSIEAWGAAGGTQLYGNDFPGGRGAKLRGTFSLTAGQTLRILVGQMGENTRASNQDNAAPGGGGGSFVWNSAGNTLLIAAGGGGGGGRQDNGSNTDANTGTSGNRAHSNDNGGSGGNGGRPNAGGSSYWAGGGCGWLTDGTGGNNGTAYNRNPGSMAHMVVSDLRWRRWSAL